MAARIGPMLKMALGDERRSPTRRPLAVVIRAAPAAGDRVGDGIPGLRVRARAGDVLTATVSRDAIDGLAAAAGVLEVELSEPVDMHDVDIVDA